MGESGVNPVEKRKATTTVTVLFSIPIKSAMIRIAEENGLVLSDLIRLEVLRHISDDFPVFAKYAEEEIDAFNHNHSETIKDNNND